MTAPRPTELTLHQASRVLEVGYQDGANFRLSCEYLRVHSPSAEVQGHGPNERVLQVGKQLVNIRAIHPVGNYAVALEFDDGHRTGIYSFALLYELGRDYEKNWQIYLDRLNAAGASRLAQ